jgi:adenylate kinase family enzyme
MQMNPLEKKNHSLFQDTRNKNRFQKMKKILVVGSGGSGKSTFARRLGEALGLEVIHLDSFYWLPGWVEPAKDAWREKVSQLLNGESWVIDGNYSGTIDLRLEACDTAIFLDLPRSTCVWRIVKRAIVYRGQSRPDMAEGCNETLTWEFLRWVWSYPTRSRPKMLSRMEKHEERKTIVILRTKEEIENFICEVRGK